MGIAGVDQRDVGGDIGERLARREPAKPAADDHHLRPLRWDLQGDTPRQGDDLD